MSATADRPVTRTPLTPAEQDLAIAAAAWKRISVKLQMIAEGSTTATPVGAARTTTAPWTCKHCNMLNTARSRRCVDCGQGRPVADRGAKNKMVGESKIPTGVRLNGNHTGAPSLKNGLWAHYSFRAEQIIARGDASALLKLAICATRDYELHMHIRPAYHEKHEAAVTELLRDCTGVPATEAAWWLGAPEKWVRRQRVLCGRDAEFGEVREHDERTRRIFDLARSGKTHAQIAEMIGVSRGRVSQILAGS